MATNTADIRSIPLEQLVFSASPAQVERRAHFDKTALLEMSETIRAAGRPEQLIIVRPQAIVEVVESTLPGRWYAAYLNDAGNHNFIGTGHDVKEAAEDEAVRVRAEVRCEVADGERRCIASKMAGLREILCDVRYLTDEQVEDIQLITGLQKEGLHELAEAEGYESLSGRGLSADEIAKKVGRSKAYVYARMKLLALDKDARKAYYAGHLSASVALLLARIPVPELQKKALEEVLDDPDANWHRADEPTPMSYRDAAEHIQQNYMLRLKEAPFPTGDEKLLPAAGACVGCPKNTASSTHRGNLELFADVKDARAGVCIDPVCYRAKREAWGQQAIAQAAASGQRVISGTEANQIAKHGTHSLANGFVKLDDRCHEDKKRRTYREILGKSVTPALLQVPTSKGDEDEAGTVIEVIKKADVTDILKKKGVTTYRDNGNGSKHTEQQRAFDKKRKHEMAYRVELFTQVRLTAHDALTVEELRDVAQLCFEGIGYERQKQLLKLWGWTDKNDKLMDPYQMRGEKLTKELSEYSEAELVTFMLDCVFSSDLSVETYGTIGKPTHLLAAAKRLKIDPEKIRKQLAQEERPAKAVPAKASKKKPARKAK